MYALAAALEIAADILFHRAGRLPPDLLALQLDDSDVVRAYEELRRMLRGSDDDQECYPQE